MKNINLKGLSIAKLKIIFTTRPEYGLPNELNFNEYVRMLPFTKNQVESYIRHYKSPYTYGQLIGKYLSYDEIRKPLTLKMILTTLPDIEIDLKRLLESGKLTKDLTRTLIYMTILYKIFLGKEYSAKREQAKREQANLSYQDEKRSLRLIAYLKQVNPDITVEQIEKWFKGNIKMGNLKPIIDTYFVSKNYSDIAKIKSGRRIHFIHKSYIEFFLAEHLIEQYLLGNIHALNIGKPSEVTIGFVRGFVDLLLSDITTIKKYVLYDKSQPNTLFSSLGYENGNNSMEKTNEKILQTAKRSFDNENIITINTVNKFIVPSSREIEVPLKETENNIFWKENLQTTINDYEHLWVHRWISLGIIKKLSYDKKYERIIDKNQLKRLMLSFSYTIPSYLKALSSLDLSNIDLSRIILEGADLTYANLAGTMLIAANLKKADLSYANLIDSDLSRALIWNTTLDYANLRDIDMRGANLEFAKLNYANLARSNFNNPNKGNFTRTYFKFAKLNWSNLSGANLSQANLSRADLSNCCLLYCKWHLIKCEEADFNNAIINDKDLTKYLTENGAKNVPSAVSNDDIKEILDKRKTSLEEKGLNKYMISELVNSHSLP